MHLKRREVFYYLSFVEAKFQFILGTYYNCNGRTLEYSVNCNIQNYIDETTMLLCMKMISWMYEY